MSVENDRTWPAKDPWYRFTPRNLAIGYLSLFGALICLGSSVWNLLAGGLDTTSTVLFVVLGIVSVLWTVTATTGLREVLRRREGH
ncbi:hypothetical protein GCM10027176_17380 [Actinoallomurus bryophytorum]|uniref:Uncharacterized protein n=1 Tax=Actinoallomurus bryophytorum TaxID=1490222 RepID=A0A543CLY5_9ACTN|nr:hypothetical protein [Actinoallomurus bryophytorum]TQL97970.1 hypothetical protein FB559_3582 [Actinoallomurus bryophytorum]